MKYLLTSFLALILLQSCIQQREEIISEPEHGKYHRIAQMAEDEIEMTQNPQTLDIPKHKLYKIRKALAATNDYKALTSDSDWELRGPNDVGGRTRAMFFDKRDTTNNTIFAGSVSGGLWKCTNALISPNWERVESYLGNPSIGSLIQDPHNYDVMYAGTGEGWFSGDAYQGDGLYKSEDGGETWNRLVNTNNEAFYYNQKMLITPDSVLLVATRNNGVLRSRDGGNSWSIALNNLNQGFSNRIADIEMTPGGTIFVSAGIFSQDGLYKSEDGGEQWDYIDLGIDDYERIEVVVSEKDTNFVMLLVQESEGNACGYVMISKDNGITWEQKTVPVKDDGSPMADGQAWYDLAGGVDPNDSDVLFAGGVDLYKSTNGGDNWRKVTNWFEGAFQPFVHADQHGIFFIGGSSENVLFINDGGVWLSEDAEETRPSFTDLSMGYVTTQYYACDIHPEEDLNYYIGGAQDNGTELIRGEGLSSSTSIGGGDGAYCHIDRFDTNIVIRSSQRGNYTVSTGANFTDNNFYSVPGDSYFINPSGYDDIGKILYASSNAGKYHWFNVLSGEEDSVILTVAGGNRMSAFTTHPSDNNILFVGTNDGRIIKVTDPTSASPASEMLFNGPGFTRNIDIDSENPDRMLCTYSNFGIESVYYSENGGENWRSIEGNLPDIPVRWGIFNPGLKEEVIIATEVGIWKGATSQSQVEWENISGSIGLGRVNMLKFRESDQQVLAASYGKGLFTTNMFGRAGLRFEDSQINVDITDATIEAYCNPVRSTTIDVNTVRAFDADATVTIEVSDQSTAIEGTDFVIENKSKTLTAGELTTSFEILYLDNAIVEDDKSLILNLESDKEVLRGTVEITIKENDIEFTDGAAATPVSIGNDNIPTKTMLRGFYEDSHTQILYRADYLNSFGLGEGEIRRTIFDIFEKESEDSYENFSFKIGTTDLDEIVELENTSGFTEVFFGSFTSVEGTNVIDFATPFYYDGSSNLIIDICFDNDDYSDNDFVTATMVDYSAFINVYEDGVTGCIESGFQELGSLVPNFAFDFFRVSSILEEANVTFQSTIFDDESIYIQRNDSLLCAFTSLVEDAPETCFSTELLSSGNGVVEKENTFWVDRVLYVENEGGVSDAYELIYYMPKENSEEWMRPHIEALYSEDKVLESSDPEWTKVEIIEMKESEKYFSFKVAFQGDGSYAIGISDRSVSTNTIEIEWVYDSVKYFDLVGRQVMIENENYDPNVVSGMYIKTYFNKGQLVKTEKIFVTSN